MTGAGVAPLRTVVTGLLAIAAVVVGLLLLILYLRLGWFVVPILLAGAALAVAVTRRWWRPAGASLAIPIVLAAYAGATWLAWQTLVDRKVERSFAMRWTSRGGDNTHGATEVVLDFVRYPGHYVGEYSDDLYAYLSARPGDTVAVTFSVSRDLGWCTRGFHAVRVGELTSWRSAWGYAGATGTTPSPWRHPWWCP